MSNLDRMYIDITCALGAGQPSDIAIGFSAPWVEYFSSLGRTAADSLVVTVEFNCNCVCIVCSLVESSKSPKID